MSKKQVAFSVRFNSHQSSRHVNIYVRYIGVGDGIGRVWGLKNVQGQRDLSQHQTRSFIAEVWMFYVTSGGNGGVFVWCPWNVLELGGR